ncbi:hypothetical protein BOTBODRAFT_423156 [Botryobasidium botryosum FD-172 SS1]|uniref:Uncharacterized protein n=1 Tax=Botryobasidium botryosum (strain FD-172 SS1) TaxID=930990 RepID=A0A067M9F4_BOTB1|nr:hypothetical protein BOTBODRAFT_423156 [Botryobasidium botryosum FD-172 SS1]
MFPLGRAPVNIVLQAFAGLACPGRKVFQFPLEAEAATAAGIRRLICSKVEVDIRNLWSLYSFKIVRSTPLLATETSGVYCGPSSMWRRLACQC